MMSSALNNGGEPAVGMFRPRFRARKDIYRRWNDLRYLERHGWPRDAWPTVKKRRSAG